MRKMIFDSAAIILCGDDVDREEGKFRRGSVCAMTVRVLSGMLQLFIHFAGSIKASARFGGFAY